MEQVEELNADKGGMEEEEGGAAEIELKRTGGGTFEEAVTAGGSTREVATLGAGTTKTFRGRIFLRNSGRFFSHTLDTFFCNFGEGI